MCWKKKTISETISMNTGVLQGCVLGLLWFISMTHDCWANYNANIIKCADSDGGSHQQQQWLQKGREPICCLMWQQQAVTKCQRDNEDHCWFQDKANNTYLAYNPEQQPLNGYSRYTALEQKYLQKVVRTVAKVKNYIMPYVLIP